MFLPGDIHTDRGSRTIIIINFTLYFIFFVSFVFNLLTLVYIYPPRPVATNARP